MHANTLLRTIVGRLSHASEAARDELLEGVDAAFPPPADEPAADAPAAGTPDTPTKAK